MGNPKHLVLAPGGLVVYAYAGFFISNSNILKDVESVTGASAGALWGMLYAFGYSPDRILEILLSVNLKEVLKPSAVAFVRHYGVYPGDVIRKCLLSLVDDRDLTFSELDVQFNVGAYCLNLARTVYFSRDATPGVKVVDAVMASMCVPGLMAPVKINDMLYVDGGFADVWPADPVIHFNPEEVLKVASARDRVADAKISDIGSLGDYFKLMIWCACRQRYDCNMNVRRVDIQIAEGVDMYNFSADYEELLKIVIMGQDARYFLKH